ncbi:hypothetical protein JCM30471_29380 [Desulfuromonas carbonis]
MPEPLWAEVRRLQRPIDRQRSLTGKLLLREILIGAFGYPADILQLLHRTPEGRPTLGPAGPGLSISHAGELVACAVSRSAVGIDIEARPVADLESCLQVFAPPIAALIRRSPDPEQTFLRYWTRTESVLKALGTGLALAPDQLAFAAETVAVAGRTWHTRELDPGRPGHTCYLATPQPARVVEFPRPCPTAGATAPASGRPWGGRPEA